MLEYDNEVEGSSSINTFSRLLFHLRKRRGRHTLWKHCETYPSISIHTLVWSGKVDCVDICLWNISIYIHPYTGMEWISALYKLCFQRALTLHQTLHKKRPHFKTDNHTSWILHEGIRNEITRRWRQDYFIIVFFSDHNSSWWSNGRDLDLQWEWRISQCS